MNTKKSCHLMMDQIERLIDQLTVDQYAQKLDLFNGSSIGQHVRHIHDFYATVTHASQKDILDYSKRERNTTIEESSNFALSCLCTLRDQLEDCDEDKTIDVIADFTVNDHDQVIVKSTLGRELVYAYDHAIHHLAIIKMGIRHHFPGCNIDEDLGVAASTLRHREQA